MTKINLTPIIDVVFILLIFFMLATNFQKFSKTDISLSSETASISQSEKKIFLIEFGEKHKEAIGIVREKRKGAIETKEQEDFILSYKNIS